MSRLIDLPDIISLFPLGGALLLPRANLPLHIFEPRYLAMFEDALKTPERLIGMIQPQTRQDPDGLHKIGCVGRITQFAETEDGRYMITLTGISRFRLREEVSGFVPYRRAEVSWSDFKADRAPEAGEFRFERRALLELLRRFFCERNLQTDWETLEQAEDELLINSLSMLLDFEAEEKQALLEAPTLESRLETLIALMEFAMRQTSGDDVLQ